MNRCFEEVLDLEIGERSSLKENLILRIIIESCNTLTRPRPSYVLQKLHTREHKKDPAIFLDKIGGRSLFI